MKTIDQLETRDAPKPATARPGRRIVVSATFTAEPVREALDYWLEELALGASVEFAPHNQVFQQLLDPGSLVSHNRQGVNVVLTRLEDWIRYGGGEGRGGPDELLARNASDLVEAVWAAVTRSPSPLIIGLCPSSPEALADPSTRELYARTEKWIAEKLEPLAGVYQLRPSDFDSYPVADYHDPSRDRLGHIPYTTAFFTALGTILARKIFTLFSPPRKVVVLDCDNTLWKGVVGEDGVDGISITPSCKALQRFVVDLAAKGFLICLCSKNQEVDVLAVFERRPDMILKRQHLVSWQINWQSKSQNMRLLARALKLGLDSFIFLDDSPVECAEVRSGCPEVLTLRVRLDDDIEGFLRHVWAFDRLRVTAEDAERTTMYQQEADRTRFKGQAPTIGDFLAGLELRIRISESTPEQTSRVAQLTQRTNQFNFTTVRRHDNEIRRLTESGLECLTVEVSDRFGDYGLVGVMIFGVRGDVLEVDTFLLSCRVLGRGVEHRMVNELGAIARRRQLSLVVATLIPTKSNQPARDFLEAVAAPFRRPAEGSIRYEFPADAAETLIYSPGTAEGLGEPEGESPVDRKVNEAAVARCDSQFFERIATELALIGPVVERIKASSGRPRSRPKLDQSFVAPRNQVEAELAAIWTELLRLEPVGIRDNYFELGGTSLLAVDLFARLEQRFGRKLPLTSVLEAPTIEQLSRLIMGTSDRDSLVLIREGGGRPPLFLVHDGDGETLLYAGLAQRLGDYGAVYGLQPHSRDDAPIAHTRIADMAAYHINKIRSVQPRGPYLLGGMCAGGVIAFEIALRLQSEGENVALVALLDAADAKAPVNAWRTSGQRIRSFSSVMRHDQSAGFGHRVLSLPAKVFRKIANLTVYLFKGYYQQLRDDVRITLFRFYLDRGRTWPKAFEPISVRAIYTFAEKNYEPATLFDGKVVLFRATRGDGADEPLVDRYQDPLLGWGRRSSQQVEVYDVPGGHSSMLQEPNVRVLAAKLEASISDALSDELPSPHSMSARDAMREAART